ncbi:MAG: Cof-type HAD-IIB family hydrolase [Streptococcaceae bacterium]|jgi:peptidyl-prolyl cis-trans isomerase B (cyclophilin B)|nr:Cof-type HAD-IIB family hydrolase [Streptococcaceae bacterium]
MNLGLARAQAKEIRIIFFDIDDTLRNSETGFIPDSVTEVFAQLQEKGILTGIATGRTFSGVPAEIRALAPDYFVTANGARVVQKDGKVVYDRPLSLELASEIMDWLHEEKSEAVFYGADALHATAWSRAMEASFGALYKKFDVAPTYYLTHAVYQIVSVSERDQALVLPEALARQVRRVRWHELSSDIVPLKGSKADGVARILDDLGLSADNVMNFGDGLNDRELFEFSGLSVAMANAHPEILKMADVVTGTIEADGILSALTELEILK